MKIILSFILLFAYVTISYGDEIKEVNGISYLIYSNTQTASVTSLDGREYVGSVTIPASIVVNEKKYTVNEIFNGAFYHCKSLTAVNIPNTVTVIKRDAFDGCVSLISLKIPNSVTKIERDAFCGCSSLKKIEIPLSVTELEENVFSLCKSLQYVCMANVSIIPEGVFFYCVNLEYVEIPASVKYISSDAFSGCKKLKELRIPENSTIGGGKLENCDAKIVRYPSPSPQLPPNTQLSTSQPEGSQQHTIIVEQHRDPQPVQEWVPCGACGNSAFVGLCQSCYGSGVSPYRDERCFNCKGNRKCTHCAGNGGRYVTVYR